jgi:hypothetical protein
LCGDIARLKFVDADQSETVLPSSAAVFVLTRFVQHRWVAAAQRYFPRRQIYLDGAGITSLADRIRRNAANIFFFNAKSAEENTGR